MSDNTTLESPTGALSQWIASLRVGDTLTVDDIHRFVRVELALRNADKHHQQARAMTAERDEWRDAAKWSEHQHQYWKQVAEVVSAAGVRLQQSLQHDPTFAAMVKKFEIPISRAIIAQTPEGA
jgi:hypothetical protein